MASNLLTTPSPTAELIESRPLPPTVTAPHAVRVVAAALSWAMAAVAALAVHLLVPDGQELLTAPSTTPPWRQPYPLLLEAGVLLALLLAVAAWAWRALRPWAHHYAPLLAGAFTLLAVWDLSTLKLDWLHLPFFPGPAAVLECLVDDRKMLARSVGQSLLLLASGYLIGVSAGLFTGVVVGWFPRARFWGMPVLKLVGPIPATVLVPLAMALWPSSFLSAAVLIGFAVWFPVTMLTSSGIANVPISYLDVARTLGAGRLYLIFRVAIPAALPNIFLGLFMGLGASFLTLAVAETVGVESGLGWYLNWRRGSMDFAHAYASVIIMAAFFSTIMTLLFKVRERVLKWQKGVLRW